MNFYRPAHPVATLRKVATVTTARLPSTLPVVPRKKELADKRATFARASITGSSRFLMETSKICGSDPGELRGLLRER